MIPFISKYPRPYLITETTGDQVAIATMTTTEDRIKEVEGATQYVVVHETAPSKYVGSLINYNTLLIIG